MSALLSGGQIKGQTNGLLGWGGRGGRELSSSPLVLSGQLTPAGCLSASFLVQQSGASVWVMLTIFY